MRTTGIGASLDTARFEFEAVFDEQGTLTSECARRICASVDEHGFAVIGGVFSDREAADALTLVRSVIDDRDRERGSFASQTDTAYKRRDFCPLPSTEGVLAVCSTLAHRARRVLGEYCGLTRPVLEISTLTSYRGSSHQYLHRDPSGVLCMFVALGDVAEDQGGTVFAPGTHPYSGSGRRHGGRAALLMRLYEVQTNVRVLAYNLRKVLRMRRTGEAGRAEFRDRLLSRRADDNHQPNLARFLLARNPVFSRADVGLRTLVRQVQHGRAAAAAFELVQVTPRRGSVIVYRSDVLHAGPDNRSDTPRYVLNVNIARDVIHPDRRSEGYSAHSTLLANPLALGDLLEMAERRA